MKSCVTISLVSSLRGGPWILWDDLATSCRKAADLGFDAVELFTEGPSAGQRGELTAMLAETGLSLGSVGTGAGKVIRGLTLTDPDEGTRTKARAFVSDMIAFGAQHKAPTIIGSTGRSPESRRLGWAKPSRNWARSRQMPRSN